METTYSKQFSTCLLNELYSKFITMSIWFVSKYLVASSKNKNLKASKTNSVPFFLKKPEIIQREIAQRIIAYKEFLIRQRAQQFQSFAKMKFNPRPPMHMPFWQGSHPNHHHHRHPHMHPHHHHHHNHHTERRDRGRSARHAIYSASRQKIHISRPRIPTAAPKPQSFRAVNHAIFVRPRSSTPAPARPAPVFFRPMAFHLGRRKLQKFDLEHAASVEQLFKGDVKVMDFHAKIDSSYTSYFGATGTTGNEVSSHVRHMPLNVTTEFP